MKVFCFRGLCCSEFSSQHVKHKERTCLCTAPYKFIGEGLYLSLGYQVQKAAFNPCHTLSWKGVDLEHCEKNGTFASFIRENRLLGKKRESWDTEGWQSVDLIGEEVVLWLYCGCHHIFLPISSASMSGMSLWGLLPDVVWMKVTESVIILDEPGICASSIIKFYLQEQR